MQFPRKTWFIAGALFFVVASLQASTFTWTGSISTDWFVPGNWSPAGPPGTNDTVNFNTGTINFSSPVTFDGQFNWGGGTLIGNSLTLFSNAVMNITANVALQNVLTNDGTVSLTGSGSVTLYNNGSNLKGTVYNQPGGLWDIQNNSSIGCACYGPEFIVNAGLFRKSIATGSSTVGVIFTNIGTVTALSGTLNFSSGGMLGGTYNASAGTVINFNGGNFTYTALPVLNGPGIYQFNGGSLTLGSDVIPNLLYTGGTLTLGPGFQGGSITNFTFNGGTLAGNNTVSGTFNFGGGTLSGSLLVAGGATMNWSGGAQLGPMIILTNGIVNITGSVAIQNVLTNGGTVTTTGSGSAALYDNNSNLKGTVYNQPGGLWDIQNNSSIGCACYGPEFMVNAGLLRKSIATGSSSVGVIFTNIGTVTALSGTLNFSSGGMLGGTYNASAGAAINFNGGAFSYTTLPLFNGPGTYQLNGSASLTLANDVIPNLQLTGGTITLGPAFQGGTITNFTFSGGTLNGSNTVTGTFNWGGGTLSGDLQVAGGAVVNWSGGAQLGPLIILTNGIVNITGSVAIQNVLTNGGTVTTTGSGSAALYNNNSSLKGTVYNQPGGLWDIQNNSSIGCACYGPEFMVNAGLLRKSIATGSSTVGVIFTNIGTVTALSGTLNFSSGGMLGGTYNASAGTVINFNGGNFTYTALPVFNGPGIYQFNGGTLTLASDVIPNLLYTGGTLTLGPGFQGGSITNFTFNGGALAGNNTVTGTFNFGGGTFSGSLLVAGGATMNWSGGAQLGPLIILTNGIVNITGSVAIQNVLTNGGTVTTTGSGSAALYNNNSNLRGTVYNQPGGLWDIQNNSSIGCACYGPEFIVNAGLFQKSIATGSSTVGVIFTNIGAVSSLAGSFNFSGGGDLTGTYNTGPSATINFNGGSFTMNVPPIITGSGLCEFTGTTLTLNQDLPTNLVLAAGTVLTGPLFQNGGAISNLTLSGSTLASADTVSGTFNWAAGAIAAPLTIASNAVMNITGNVNLESQLTNAGTVTMTGAGNVTFYNNNSSYKGALYNLAGGLWDIQNNNNFSCACYGIEFVNNAGLLRKSAGAGVFSINVLFTNTGTVSALTGTINFNSGGGIGGTYNTAAATVINFNGGSFTMGVPPLITGSGVTEFTAGTLTLLQDMSPNLALVGGTLLLGPLFQGGSITNLTLSGAVLASTNTLAGTFNWSGGTILGPLTVASNAVMNITGSVNLENALTNNGTVTMTGAGNVTFYNNNSNYKGALYNQAGGLWDIQNNNNFSCACYGPEFVSNAGLFRKSAGSGIFSVNVIFNNAGTVSALVGTINFNSGGGVWGTYNTAASAVINLNGGPFTMGAPPLVTGSGITEFAGGTLTANLDLPPNLGLVGGSLFLGPLFQNNGSISNLTINGSTLASTNTVTGTFNLSGGAVGGPLTIAANALLNLNNGGNVNLLNVLTNAGTVTMTGPGGMTIYNNLSNYRGGVYNLAGGLWDIQTNVNIACACYGNEFFNNAGIVQKFPSAGPATISVHFTSLGTVDVQTGTLNFNSGAPAYAQTGAALNFGLGGTNVSGLINVSGAMNFDGTLSANLLNGYVPAQSNSFTLMNYGTHGGSFNNLALPAPGANLGWQVVYNASTLVLSVVSNTGFAAQILGSVKDNLNHAITNVAVFAYTTNATNLYLTANTDPGGNYAINVPNGTWTVGVLGLPALGFNAVTNQVVVVSGANQTVNFVAQPFSGQTYVITTGVNPPGTGTATGGGSFAAGSTVTLTATPITNTLPYIFGSWTENGVFESSSNVYSFTAVRNRQLVANFTLPSYLITASNNPAAGGSITGAGSYFYASTNLLTAFPNFGYNFTNWTEGAAVVGNNLALSTVVFSNHNFVANYTEANVSHVVTTATAPPGLAVVAGAGTYTNGQTASFSTPPLITNGGFVYTFQQYTLSNTIVSYGAAFGKTFSTLDVSNLLYVANYTAKSVAPQVAAVTANYAGAIPATTNLLLAVRFDRTMQTNFYPAMFLTNSSAASQLTITTNGGQWSSFAFLNDTYNTPPVTIGSGLNGTNQLFVSGGKDLNGDALTLTNPAVFVVQATPPAAPVISVISYTGSTVTVGWPAYVAPADLSQFRVYLQTTNFNSVAGLSIVTGLGTNARSFQFSGLSLDTPYYAEIQAVDSAGNPSPFTPPLPFAINSVLPPPVAVTQTPVGANTASLSWSGYNTAPLLGFSGFKVYYATSNFTSVAALTPLTNLGPATFTYPVSGLDRTKTYYFAVVGYNYTNGFNPSVATASWTDPYAGNIGVNTTIGGPGQTVVNIYQSIAVVSNATLTIPPGTTLLFAPGKGLTVQSGTLLASGTALNPIIFDSANDTPGNTPAPGDWGGVTLGSGAGTSILNFVEILYGAGLTVNGCAPTVSAFTANNNAPYGLGLLNSASLSMSDALVSGNGIGLQQSDFSSLSIGNSVIQNNGTNALVTGATAMSARSNWWGSAVTANVQATIQGNVTFQPFLTYEPVLTPAIGTVNGITQIGTSSANLQLACRTADTMRLSEDYTFAGVFFGPFTNFTTFPLSPGGGLKHIFAQFRSVTGQTNAPLELDLNYITGGPVIQTFSLPEGTTLNRPVTVTGSATAILGMLDLEFYVDGVLQSTNPGGSFSQFFDIRTLNNAIHKVKLLARDNATNITTLENNVVISVNPPLAPNLTTPGFDYITNGAGLNISGAAEPNIAIQVTDNGQIIGSTVTDATGKFGVTNATLMEDVNAIVAIASDIIGTTASAPRHVTVETMPPAQLVMNTPTYVPNSGLNVTWHYPGSGKLATTFELFWGTNAFGTTNQAAYHSILLGSMNYAAQGLANGTYYFGVVGYDSAGNPSPLSALVQAVYDSTPPALNISYGHPSPVGVGPLSIVLTSSKALAAPPSITLRPNGAFSPVLLSLTNVALNTYQSGFNVTAATPTGPVSVQGSAQDQVGNVFNGTPTGPALMVDTTPPAANIITTPAPPVQTAADTNVSVNVALTKPAGAGTTPTLTYIPPTGSNVPVILAGAGSNWNGTLTATAAMGSGIGQFVFSAQDSVGNLGSNILSGKQLELYNTALPSPPATPTGFVATSLPGGRVSLAWNVVSNAQIYRLYREPGTNFTLPGVLDIDNLTSNNVIELPPGDGFYSYGISASRLSSESAISNLVALSDRTPPPAPTNVVVALAPSGVQVTWQQPAGEVPNQYKIYRNGALIQTVTTITPVVDYPPRGTNTYVVSAADVIGNENPSAPASIQLLVSPVNNILVLVNYGQAPVVSWVSTDPTAVGFNIYRNGIRQNVSLVPGTNYTDSLPLSDLVQYAVTAVNNSAQESPPRLVEVYPLGLGLLANPLGGVTNNSLFIGYFDRFQLGITNQSSSSNVPLSQIQFNRTVPGLNPLTVTQNQALTINAGTNLQQTVVFPESTAVATETLQVSLFQQTDSQGSRVIYQDAFTLSDVELPGSEISVSVNQLPLAGGLTPFQLQVFNRGYSDIEFIVSTGFGGAPGDIYVAVQNSLGQEVGRTAFQGTPAGTTFLPDGRGFLKVSALSSVTFTVPNVLTPAALTGASNVVFVAGISNIYYQLAASNQVANGPLTGSMVSSSLAQTPYYGTSHTDKTNYSNDDPVIITGQALDSVSNLPVPNSPLNIGFATRGFQWYHAVTTDAGGNYQYTLNPSPGFAGTLSIWAAHPLVVDQLNQSQIFIYRMYANPTAGNVQMSKNDTFDFTIRLLNPGNTPLTGFSYGFTAYTLSGTNQTPTSKMTGTNLIAPGFVIAPGQTQTITLQLSATIDAPDNVQVEFTFTSAEGASATFDGNVNLLPAVPVLAVVSPPVGYLQVSVDRGDQVSGQITIANNGLRDLQGVTVLPPTNETWISVGLPVSSDGQIHLPDLAVGQSNTFTVIFNPPTNTPLAFYQDQILIKGTNAALPFAVGVYPLVTSDLTGGVQFFVDDILGEAVPNAALRLHNADLLANPAAVYTDTNGLVTITNLQEGSWDYEVTASGCSTLVGTVNIVADQVAYQHTRLSRSLVTVTFTVVPVPFTDTYDIQVDQTFETHVPVAELVLNPPFINLSNVMSGFQANVIVNVQNYGLIETVDVALTGNQQNGLQLTPLITYIPIMLPMQSIDVPFTITYTGPTPGQQSRQSTLGGCIGGSIPGGGFLDPNALAGVAAIIAGIDHCVSDQSPQSVVATLGVLAIIGILAASYADLASTIAGTIGSFLSCIIGNFLGDSGGGGGGGAIPGSEPGFAVPLKCLEAETRVLLADGSLKRICDVHTNDVLRTGLDSWNVAPVSEITSLRSTNIYELHFGNSDDKLLATGEHYFWVDGQGWVPVTRLKPGDWLFNSKGKRLLVTANELTKISSQVYSVSLSGDNAFYANDILVHDACGLAPAPVRTSVKGVAR